MGTTEERKAVVNELGTATKEVQSPLQRMETSLHPWVVFVVVPLFGLANAGVSLDSGFADVLTQRVTLGVLLGLVVGKQLGITLFTWLAVRSGLAAMPADITSRQVYGIAWLGGIGFTMSLFITGLAFTDGTLVSESKVGILVASIICGIVGWLILRGVTPFREDGVGLRSPGLPYGLAPQDQGRSQIGDSLALSIRPSTTKENEHAAVLQACGPVTVQTHP